ncbi:uncharacterized protein LOC130164515 [Seriola aureovittata]|uniref:uncharacterized protein LOC130164515 n=1 Tax=Seriola aureovittata TaxID=2871759 RepID=UPI0024BD73D9|nr:uncharacterized protein LOC130164515 [Seriola aureovittata]
MMKLWSRLCFLVLAISSISRGQLDSTSDSSRGEEGSPAPSTDNRYIQSLNETENNSTNPTEAPTPLKTTVTENATDDLSADSETTEKTRKGDEDDSSFNTTVGGGGTTKAPVTALDSTTGSVSEGAGVGSATVFQATSSKPEEDTGGSSWGYVILVLIILVIIVLCVILYFLRRVSRTYSFDLQRPNPIINQFNEPTGTFEPVYLDDLERPAPKEQVTTNDLSTPPVSNGTSLQPEENGCNGENDLQEEPDANGLETSPTSPSSGDDPADKTSNSPSSTNLFFDAIVETQQNENNNNPCIFSTDPFVEINLDEPAWCNQLLTSPEATSSVLPFSPFSFSSSSSS